jgi:hypothetical protein
MPGFDEDGFWKFAAWAIAVCVGAVAVTLALGLEPPLLG